MTYSKTIHADSTDSIFEASSFSLALDKNFFCFDTEWIDNGEYEYYQLNFSILTVPIGVDLTKDKYLIDPSSISILPSSKINVIELYSNKDNLDNDKRITYDSALVFHQENKKYFLIGISETVADLTQFIRNEEAIKKRLKGLEKRLEWR